MICEVSGEWGQVPKGWARLQPMNPKFYITSNVDYKKSSPFEFNKDASNAMEIPWKKYDDFCVQLVQEVDVGTHVLTIVPTNDTFKFSFGFVLIP